MPTWMNRTKEAEAERAAAFREQRQRNGNCIRCGFKRAENSQQLCEKHLKQERAYQLKRYHAGKRPLNLRAAMLVKALKSADSVVKGINSAHSRPRH